MLSALLWNLLLTAALAAALASFGRLRSMRRRPALRHWLWLLLLAKLVTPPLVPVPLLPAVAGSGPAAAPVTASSQPAEQFETALGGRALADSSLGYAAPPVVDEAAAGDVRGITSREPPSGSPVSYLGGLLAVSLLGTCVLLAIHGVRAARLYRWLGRTGAHDSRLAEACARVASRLKIRTVVRSCVVDTRTTPMLWVWRRPMVVLPQRLIDDLSPQQLESIVAHELAHLARRDHWANGFVFVVRALFWWNPVVWWADRELRGAQELCCDAIAIDRLSASRRGYATTLLKALEFVQTEPPAPRQLVLAMVSGGSILRRFEMIAETRLTYRLSPMTLLVLLALAIPLVCIPVRGQDEGPAVSTTPAPSDAVPARGAAGAEGKNGQLHLDFGKISRWIVRHKQRTGHYPKDLQKLNKPLPRDVYSPTGEDYRYKAQRGRFTLSSCGEDGIYGNDDDEISIAYRGGATSGPRYEQDPLGEDEVVEAQTEKVLGERPRGNCSISGKVVSAATGCPVDHARMYLFYLATHGSIFIDVASDGAFTFKDIPTGPFLLRTSRTAGYQDAVYDPEGKSGPLPQFSLEDGENRSGLVLKVKRAHSVSGKVLDENGKVPENTDTLNVLAWTERDDGKKYKSTQARVNRADGSYRIDGLAGKPIYVMAINWRAAKEGNAYPPIYYPSSFSRSDAKLLTFDEERSIDNINITLEKEGGLILAGTVMDETGKPVPEAFVAVHRRDMLFDFVTAYTDEQGRYQIQGLGDGEFLTHVDAVHRGFVRMRTPIDLDGARTRTQRDFTLTQGVAISGKFVDEEGNDWQIGQSHGYAHIINDQQGSFSSFSLTGFRNKYRPKDVTRGGSGGSFASGEGGYEGGQMLFPTKSTFVIQGMMLGHTMIGFLPNKEGQKVARILYDGRNIKESGIVSKPGQEIKDVTIVIAAP